jgi:hypothetical protein
MPLANYLILERRRRKMSIEIVAQWFSSSVGAECGAFRSYGAGKNRPPGSIKIPRLWR